MTKKLISSNSKFEKEIAYSRAVVVNNWVYVSGTTGYDYDQMILPENIIEQTENCFLNIQKALKEAGTDLSSIIKITYIVADKDGFESCWPTIRKYLGNVNPAATMISAGLLNDKMKIEIEVTAFVEF